MSDQVKPALTPEEWAHWLPRWANDEAPEDAHPLAALALHGQPFGFTREDVTKLRGLMLASLQDRTVFPDGRIAEWWHSLIARIEALLPPEDTQ